VPVRLVMGLLVMALGAAGLDQPWISDTFFYWYSWDRDTELGAWVGGVHNTPLQGYYDSRTLRDNQASLRCASEWGMTHHFIDYWAPTWLGEDGQMREKTVFRAAEQLRGEGYDIWMGYYQDGMNFEMRDFAKNVAEHRDVYQWLRDFGRSPVWPRLQDRPLQLVYGRNGSPVLSTDHGAFRAWLQERYGGLAGINEALGTHLADAGAIRLDLATRGPARAAAADFLFSTWQNQWRALDQLVQQEFGLPGIRASFDVGYGPYQDLGYVGFTQTFCGPHSYGGIFGPPHDQDTERFIQVQVAKHLDSVFFDHFKNYYHDWNIRIPGGAYLPDPFNFDRCWTLALMHRAEALLHMSWNEWWEGSNLEPCEEFGKTFCEKNMFYATVMKRCFEDIRTAHLRARVGVILNDYALRCGTLEAPDLYRTILALRRAGVAFDLVPDVQLDGEMLKRFAVMVVPACGVGLGRNAGGEDLTAVLAAWASSGGALVGSADARLAAACGIHEAEAPAGAVAEGPGPDLNLFVDVGVAGDERFVVAGCAGRENWGALPAGAVGAGTDQTVRWTPASGSSVLLRLPCSPGRNHVLRFAGTSLWDNAVSLRVGTLDGASVAIQPGYNVYELAVPTTATGGAPVVSAELVFAQANVPFEKDPRRFPDEKRVCNLALDWLQFSTEGVPAGSRELRFALPTDEVVFADQVLAVTAEGHPTVPQRAAPWLEADGAVPGSRYGKGQPRDLLVPVGKGRIAYVNGSFADFATAREAGPDQALAIEMAYWRTLLGWAMGEPLPPPGVVGADVGGECLRAGTTDILLAYHYEAGGRVPVRFSVPLRDTPLSEALVLSADGEGYAKLDAVRDEATGRWQAEHPLEYYGVVAFVHAPIAMEVPNLEALPGESVVFPVTLTNLTVEPVKTRVQVTSIVPTLGGSAVAVEVPPRGTAVARLPVTVAAAAEWGRRTVTLEVGWGESTAVFFRPFVVLSPPDLEVTARVNWNAERQAVVRLRPNRLGQGAPIRDLRALAPGAVRHADQTLAAGESSVRGLGKVDVAQAPELREVPVRLEYKTLSLKRTFETTLRFPALPETLRAGRPDAVPVVACNRGDTALGPEVFSLNLPVRWKTGRMVDDQGRALPCQVVFAERKPPSTPELLVALALPARSAAVYWLLPEAPVEVPTDLAVTWEGKPGSGSAILHVGNSFLEMAIAEADGGTVSSLVSKRTGRDYGQHSFDTTVGRFTAPDRPLPTADTVQTIREEKQRLSSTRGHVAIGEQGPLRLLIHAGSTMDRRAVGAVYEVTAYADAFRVFRGMPAGRREGQPEEFVVLDTAFRPNGLRKTYPSFAGIDAQAPQPHYGWRYSDWVPELITLFDPDARDEAISLFVDEARGIDRVRQGFWPPARPAPGPRALASVEFVCRQGASPGVWLTVRIHPGYHLQAKQWQAARRAVELSILSATPEVAPWPAPAPVDWWHPAWPLRAQAEVTQGALAESAVWGLRIDPEALAGQGLEPTSVRLFERTGERLQELACTVDEAAGAVTFVPAVDRALPRRFEAYFDRRGAPAKPAGPWGTPVPVISQLQADFESGDGWRLEGAAWTPGRGREGSAALAFDSTDDAGGPRVAVYGRALPAARSTYRVRFWARAEGQSATLACNVYGGARYDFGQVHTPLEADGQWHRYEIEVATGDFPATAGPQLRFWTMPGRHAVSLDDVEVTRLTAPGRTAALLPARCESLPGVP